MVLKFKFKKKFSSKIARTETHPNAKGVILANVSC